MLNWRRIQSGEVKIRREASGILDLHTVVVNGEVDRLSAVLVAAVRKGVHQRFAERVRRNLQLFVTFNLTARPCRQIQMLEAKCNGGVHQLEDVALHMGIVEKDPLIRSLEPAHLDFKLRVVDAVSLAEKHGGAIQQDAVPPQLEMVEQRGGVFGVDAFIQSADTHRLSRRIPNGIHVKIIKQQLRIRLVLPFAPEATPRKEHPLVFLLSHDCG